jgi:hypothetical protein
MKPHDDEPIEEGGDPACWAHLFEDDEDAAGADETQGGVEVTG